MKLKNGQEVTFRPLSGMEKLSLLRAYNKYADLPAAMVRLEAAALGLGWLLPAPSWRSLKERDYDLLVFGEEVAACLADQDPIALADEADRILTEAFRALSGSGRDASKNSSAEKAAPPSGASSASESNSTETRSGS